MILLDTNYACALSKIAFNSIVESLQADLKTEFGWRKAYIAFIDGDSANLHSVLGSIYDMKKCGNIVYMITLISHSTECSAVLKHFSDGVVDKRISYNDLLHLARETVVSPSKVLADNTFGDIWGGIFKTSQKEYDVLRLLLDGHSQYEISRMLNLSVKTISSYKVKAVKRHGVRNFNELYMLKLNREFHRC